MVTKYLLVDEALAIAQTVYRLQGNCVIAPDRHGPQKITNKAMFLGHVNGTALLDITDSDRATAVDMVMYIQQRVLLNTLRNLRNSEFLVELQSTITMATVQYRDFGRIMWTPKIYADMVKTDAALNDIAGAVITSRYVGKPHDKIEFDFIPMLVKYNREHGCFRHTGTDSNGNLISFLSKVKFEKQRLKGHVKAQEISKHHGHGKVTYLNYVKAVTQHVLQNPTQE